MKTRIVRRMQLIALVGTAVLYGIFPGCVEVAILRWATPFLLHN